MNESAVTPDSSGGQLYVFSAPSGAGKTSLLNALLEKDSGVALSVSHTTRAPRPGEENGRHYHFINTADFEKMVEQQAFLEHARVFDNYYGTANAAIGEQLARGLDVILEIDWQGARQVRKSRPDAITVFIIPPSVDELRKRLGARAQDSEAVVQRRMRDAVSEISHFDEFDYVVVNADFELALVEIQTIIGAERLRTRRQRGRYADALDRMLAE